MVTGTTAQRINAKFRGKVLKLEKPGMAILRAKFKSLDFRAHCNILQISVQNYAHIRILKNV